jgi:hypothetical protein
MPLIREITVHGNHKNWGDIGNNGRASGTEVVYTVIPENSENPGWSLSQANAIALELRFEIQKLLLADAQIRKMSIPPEAVSVIHEYETVLKRVKSGISGDLSWKEKTEQATEVSNGSN